MNIFTFIKDIWFSFNQNLLIFYILALVIHSLIKTDEWKSYFEKNIIQEKLDLIKAWQ